MPVLDKLEGYEVLGLLGQGGMGEVYRVRHLQSGQIRALKLMRVELASPLDRLRFEREMATAARLHHPTLVPVHDRGTQEGQPYYIMDMVSGVQLRDYLEAELRQLAWEAWLERLAAVYARLMEGLAYVHSQGVLHRDLKPDNVIVDARARPYLLDFGLARLQQGMQLTEADTVLGTPQYMSPEQVTGQPMDERSDLYTLGVMLFEGISGHPPYSARETMVLLARIVNTEAPPLTGSGPLPGALPTLIARLLEKDPSRRVGNAAHLLEEWMAIFPGCLERQAETHKIPRSLYASRFVGRTTLLAQAQLLLEDGSGALALPGPGGSGKTRLLGELEHLCKRAGWLTVGSSGQQLAGIPFEPWIPVLRKACESVSEKGLPADLEEYRTTLAVLLPELGQPLELGEQGQYRLFQAMLQLLASAARSRGLVVLLDDVQRLDQASRDFVVFLGRSLRLHRLLLVMAWDPDAGHPGLSEATSAQVCPLEPLLAQEARDLGESMLGGPLEASAAQRLFEESEGNPLFLVELIKLLKAENRLHWRDRTWILEESNSLRHLPATIREALMRRLAGADDQQLAVARLAAMLGSSFEFDLLSRLYQGPPGQLLDRLESLRGLRIVREVAAAQGLYQLDNPAFCEVLEEGLPGPERAALHLRIAELLEAQSDPPQERIARHYLQGGQPERAAQHLLRAAETQAWACSFARAAELYQQLLGLPEAGQLLSQDQLQERLADALFGAQRTQEALTAYGLLRASDPVGRARLQRKRATCLWRQGHLTTACQLLGEALEGLGPPLPSRSLWAKGKAYANLLTLLLQRGPGKAPKVRDAYELGQSQLQLSQVLYFLRPEGWEADLLALLMGQLQLSPQLGAGEHEAQGLLLRAFARLLGPRSQLGAARAEIRRAAEIAAGLKPSIFRAEGMVHMAYTMMILGEPLVLETAQEALAQNERLGNLHGILQSNGVLVILHRISGRLTQSDRYCSQAYQIAQTTGNRLEENLQHVNQAVLAGMRLDAAQAEALLAQAQGIPATGLVALQAEAARGWMEMAAGRPPQWRDRRHFVGGDMGMGAERRLVEALASPDQDSVKRLHLAAREIYPAYQAAAWRLTAQLCAKRGDQPGAQKALDKTLALCRRWDFPLEEGLALAALGRMEKSESLLERARERLAQAGAGPRWESRV